MATPPPPQGPTPPPPPPPPPPYSGYGGGYGPPQPPQPPQGPTGPVSRSEIRPRRFWYWIAGVLALASLVGSIAIFASGDEEGIGSLTDVLGTLEELSAPGEITVDLTEGDEWAIYAPSGDSSNSSAPFDDQELDCEVRDPGGDLVPLAEDFGFSYVTLGDDTYTAEYSFDVRESGSYEVGCRPVGSTPPGTLVVGEKVQLGEVFGFFGRVALGAAVLLLGLIAVCAIALPVWLSRSRKIGEAKRAGVLTD
jgi:hypothetical protein